MQPPVDLRLARVAPPRRFALLERTGVLGSEVEFYFPDCAMTRLPDHPTPPPSPSSPNLKDLADSSPGTPRNVVFRFPVSLQLGSIGDSVTPPCPTPRSSHSVRLRPTCVRGVSLGMTSQISPISPRKKGPEPVAAGSASLPTGKQNPGIWRLRSVAFHLSKTTASATSTPGPNPPIIVFCSPENQLRNRTSRQRGFSLARRRHGTPLYCCPARHRASLCWSTLTESNSEFRP